APWISPWDPLSVDIRHRLGPPAWMDGGTRAHVLGTDQVGRDLLSRVIYGGRVSLIIGVAAVLVSSSIGVLLGLAAGYFAGRMDWTIMTLVNVMLTFPFVLLALAVIAVLGPSLVNMIIVLGIADWPLYARVIRAETLAIREREFILAGRALGMSHARLVCRHPVRLRRHAGRRGAHLEGAHVPALPSGGRGGPAGAVRRAVLRRRRRAGGSHPRDALARRDRSAARHRPRRRVGSERRTAR